MHFYDTTYYPLFHSFKGLNDNNDELADEANWEAVREINETIAK